MGKFGVRNAECGVHTEAERLRSCDIKKVLKSAQSVDKKDFVYKLLSTSICGQLRYLSIVLIATSLISCSQKVEKVTPLEIEEKTECSIDGMLLAEYGGPKAQLHYRDGSHSFHCEIKELFQVYLEPGRKAEIMAMYVQDTAAIDWKKPLDNWIDGKTAFYVVGSRLEGAMGPTYAPFKSREAAAAFIKEYGGELTTFEQLADKIEKELSK